MRDLVLVDAVDRELYMRKGWRPEIDRGMTAFGEWSSGVETQQHTDKWQKQMAQPRRTIDGFYGGM